MRAELRALRHIKEDTYGTIVMTVGVIAWAALVLALIGAAIYSRSLAQVLVIVSEFAVIALVIYIVKLFHRAYLFGHAVLISEQQFPMLHNSVRRGAAKLGLPTVPQTFLYNSNGLMNAFAARMAGRSMVLLTSALIDVQNDAQVDFVIGHELGHHAAGHLSPWMNLLKLPGTFVPFLGAAYHRSRELTADRIGAFCAENVEAARGGLYMLACGSARLNARMNVDAFAAQEKLVPPVTGFLLHLFSGYPRLTRRVVEVESFFGLGSGRSPMPAPTFSPMQA